MTERKKRNIIIGSLCGVLLLMVVGYAAFNSVLKIKGTSNINSNWDVRITNIEKIESKGATDNEGSPSYDNEKGLSATFNTNFTTPGDYAIYKIEITNNGSLDAVLKNITMPENTNNDIIFYLNKNENNEDITESLKQNDTLFKNGETGNIGYVYVTVLYRDYANQQTAETKSQTMTITFDFEQADGNGGTTGGEQAADQLIKTVVTTGDGLYLDTYESDDTNKKYIYRGKNPNNYITFNDEVWRIISLEKDGTLKIIKNDSIGSIAWDQQYARNSSKNTYCQSPADGCNAWAATSNIIGTPTEFSLSAPTGNPNTDTTIHSGTVTQDASLNIYLNNDYYNNTLNQAVKDNLIEHDFNIGTPGYRDTDDMGTNVEQEALYKWHGKVALMNITDFLRATIQTSCTDLNVAYNDNKTSVCSNNNWLFKRVDSGEWTLSPITANTFGTRVWLISSTGVSTFNDAYRNLYHVRPVVFLNKDITLSGEGTESNPYTIVS